jgi:hypothetical protein
MAGRPTGVEKKRSSKSVSKGVGQVLHWSYAGVDQGKYLGQSYGWVAIRLPFDPCFQKLLCMGM